MDTSKMSLVDPAWEYLDPTPDIFAMFHEFDKTFFGCTMGRVELKWSKRMTSCAGLMAPLEGKGGACSIRLSEPLLKLRPRKDLVQTLLHEMIHAHLHVTKCRERDPHGPKFKEHMHRINKIAGTNITVYHNFHDEVNLHKQHWWRCNGPCRNWRPYYGWVKRATNRAPSKNDFWWAQHQHNCGGQYIKVKEPEGYSKKKQAQLQKSLGKNGNLLSMIKKKYNFNHPASTVTSPKLTDIWKKKQTNVTSSNTPQKTNNSSSPFQTKSTPPNIKDSKVPSSSFSNTSITSSKTSLKTNNSSSPFQTKNPPPNIKDSKVPSSSLSNTGNVLGTSDSNYSINSILGQLHKENMQRRRQLSGKNNHSIIGHETKSKYTKKDTEEKPIYIDLTESPSVSSKNNQSSSLISKKPNSLIKQVTQDSVKKSPSKVPQSSIRDFGKALNDKNVYDSKRSFLSNKVDFIEKNVESSLKSHNKQEKSNVSFSNSISPEKKYSSGFSPTSKSSHHEKKAKSSTSTNSSSDISGSISSPKSDKKDSLLTKNDTATSLLLLKKKRKRLLSNLTDSSSDDNQIFSSLKSEKKSWTTSSNTSSRLNPEFFSSTSYKEKKPLFSNFSSLEEKKSFSSNNSGKRTSPSSSDSSSSLNKESKPLINNLNTSLSSLHKERKLSSTESNSSLSLDSKDRKYSPTKMSSSINKERKTIQTNTSSSHLSSDKERLKINSSSSHLSSDKERLKINSSSSHLSSDKERLKINSSSSHLSSDKERLKINSSSSHLSSDKERLKINSSSSHLSSHKERLKINSSPSELSIKRHYPTDSSPSHSPFKQKKVSHTESENHSSLTPKKKYSFKKLHSSPIYSDKSERNEKTTFGASSPNKIFTSSSPDEQDTPKKKEKLFAQLFGDDSDSDVETDKKNSIQKLKYPSSSSSSSSFTSQNKTKSPQKSTSGSRSKKSTPTQIQSNRLENYFNTPIKESSKNDPIIIDNYTASSGEISQSKTPQTMVPCPVCQKKVPETRINNHLDECLNMNLINENT